MTRQHNPGAESPPATPFPIVGIGASAGGLEAFTQLLKHLPPRINMGFVLVQHLDPQHESALTSLLGRATSLPVREAAEGRRVEPNHIYVIAPNTRLTIAKGVLKVQSRSQVSRLFRPIDTFFEALAEDQRERALGVVLSGTASDGTQGLGAIKAEGGITFAQDDSAKYDSMPRSAVTAGFVDFVLSPQQIARELVQIAAHPYVAGQRPEHLTPAEESAAAPRGERAGPKGEDNGYRKILLLLRQYSGVDFSRYKASTLKRRITRRLVLSKQTRLEDYASRLQGDSRELDALYADALISVTGFFRNPEAFETLQRQCLPALFEPPADDPLRVWVLGCSTGQEAYSIAMALMEVAEEAPTMPKLQIFATDLNDALLEKARYGLYTKGLVENLSPRRLRRFFVEEEGGYRVSKALRESIIFARQNLITDAPFSRMDLVSCRNLLIYLEPSVQKRALPTLHYALKPGGYLFLGASESIGGFTELFEPVDRKHRIYAKKVAHTPVLHLPLRKEHEERPLPQQPVAEEDKTKEGWRVEPNAQREADRLLLNRYAPPGVLINGDWQVLQFRGTIDAYLTVPSGKASFGVLKMAREGLMLPLRAAIHQAQQDNRTAHREDARVQYDGQTRRVNIEAIPLKNLRERCFLVLFEEADTAGGTPRPFEPQPAPERRLPRDEASQRVVELETEIAETRDYLQSVQEQYEAANEELQAANEETESTNEELQSLNEELETSKEELESSNEELVTVNEEMANRNAELNRLNNDLVNLQSSAQLPIVLLARDLSVRRFSAQAEKRFDWQATDAGRPLSHIRHNLVLEPAAGETDPPDLERLAREVIDNARAETRETRLRDRAGRWYFLRLHPYVTADNQVDGAVLVLLDIDALKRSDQATAESRDYAERVTETVREPLLVLDDRLQVESANPAFYRTFGMTPAETLGRSFYVFGNRQWDIPRLRERLGKTLARDTPLEDWEIEHDFEQLGRRTLLFNAWRFTDPRHQGRRILLAIEDITERKRTERALRQSEARYRLLLQSFPVVYRMSPDWTEMRRLTGGGFLADTEAGRDWLDAYIPPDDQPPVQAAIREAVHARQVFQLEHRVIRRDGGIGWVHSRAVPLYDENGETVEWFGAAYDITPRKVAEAKLRQSEQRYRTLFESMDQGYGVIRMLFDTGGKPVDYRFLEVNEAFEHQTGLRDAVGKRVRELIPEYEAHWFQIYGTVALTGRPQRFVRDARALGRVFDVYAFRFGGPDSRRVAVLFRDITERHRMERRITAQASELSDMNRRKDEFLAMLSHELRNPMTPIATALQLIRQGEADSAPPREYLDIIERQAQHLIRLVDDLLEVSRITTGRIQLRREQVDINAVMERAAEQVRPWIDQRGQHLARSPAREALWLDADPIRLEQIIGNLLDNASKYTGDGGRIALSAERGDGRVILRVGDNGDGMTAETLSQVFHLFSRSDRSVSRFPGGLGLGLTLVQNLAELHEGTVEARSEGPGQGSEFIVRLPLPCQRQSRPPETASPSRAPAGEDSRRRILVVDDNADAAEVLMRLLRAWGHEVRAVYDGASGLHSAAEFHPQVILLDIGLPDISGYEVACRIRQEPHLREAPIVAITGYGQDNDRQRATEAGFNEHLVKPVDFDKLRRVLASVP